jgi:hypothetical protein
LRESLHPASSAGGCLLDDLEVNNRWLDLFRDPYESAGKIGWRGQLHGLWLFCLSHVVTQVSTCDRQGQGSAKSENTGSAHPFRTSLQIHLLSFLLEKTGYWSSGRRRRRTNHFAPGPPLQQAQV